MTLFILIGLSMSGIGFLFGVMLYQRAKIMSEPDDFTKAPPSAPVVRENQIRARKIVESWPEWKRNFHNITKYSVPGYDIEKDNL